MVNYTSEAQRTINESSDKKEALAYLAREAQQLLKRHKLTFAYCNLKAIINKDFPVKTATSIVLKAFENLDNL